MDEIEEEVIVEVEEKEQIELIVEKITTPEIIPQPFDADKEMVLDEE